MHFTCESCQASLNIADEKVKGKRLVVRCKRCNSRIQIADPALGMAAILLSGQEGSGGASGRGPGVARQGTSPAPRPAAPRREAEREPSDALDTESTRAMDSEVLEKALRASKSAEGSPASPARQTSPGQSSPRQISSPRATVRPGPAAQPAAEKARSAQPAAHRSLSAQPAAHRAPSAQPAAQKAPASQLSSARAAFPQPASDAGAPGEAPWFAMIAGKQEGPLPPASLKAYAASGVLGPRSYVWTEGMPGWVRAREVPALAALFDAPPPSAPPAPSAPPSPPSRAPPPPGRPKTGRPAEEEEPRPALELDDYDPAAEHEGLEHAGSLDELDPVEQPEPRPRTALSPGYNPFAGRALDAGAGPAARPAPEKAPTSGSADDEPLELDEPLVRARSREAPASADAQRAPTAGEPGDEELSSGGGTGRSGSTEPGLDGHGLASGPVHAAAGPAPAIAEDAPGSAGPAHASEEDALTAAGEAGDRGDAGASAADAPAPRDDGVGPAASAAAAAPEPDPLPAPSGLEELEQPSAESEDPLSPAESQSRPAAASGLGFGMDRTSGSRAGALLFAAAGVIVVAALVLVFAARSRSQRQVEPPAPDGRAAAATGGGAPAGGPVVETPVVHPGPDALPGRETPARGAADPALTAEDVRRKLDQNKPSLQRCIDEALRRGPRDPALHAGRIKITLRIAPSGAVSGAKIDKDVVGESKLGACLKDATRRIVFPAFAGAPVDVDIPIDVRAGN